MLADLSSLRVGFLAGTLGRGGAERQLIYMLRALQNEGIKVRVLCLTKGEAFEQEILELGIKVDWIGRSRNNLVRLKDIICNLRLAPVDLIQSAHFYTNIYTALAGRALGIFTIGAIRNDLTSELDANGPYGRWHLRMPHRLIANSQLAVDRAAAKGIDRSRLYLIRNAVLEGNNRPPLDADTVTVLFAGRLVAQKRPEKFLYLAAALLKLHPEWKLRFLIAGDGPLRRSLEKMEMETRLDNVCVSFLGDQAQMSDVYQMSDILVLTSVHEGTPNVVLEAMANGLPIVATNVGGVPEILDNDKGIVVEPDDFERLVEATSALIVNREKRKAMGGNGRIYVRKNHSISYLQKELTAMYGDINGGF